LSKFGESGLLGRDGKISKISDEDAEKVTDIN
jgi:hypothetical protein